MKLIVLVFTFFSALNAVSSELPWCSDPSVRLSIFKVPCKEDPRLPVEFDIPELKLDFDALKKIFEGAESSGGHVVGPMNTPRRTRPLTPFTLNMKCSARLLSDGGKSVSFLSLQSTTLTESRYSTYLYEDQWKHFLTEENDLYPARMIEIPMAPAVEIGNYSVSLGYKKGINRRADKLTLSVCEANLGSNDVGSTGACAEIEKSAYSKTFKARLKTLTSNPSENLKIQKTLEVTCLK
ncbi:MAG: hypothetical protein EP319_05815 [Deltaproteobacteria bacterium]|nr:MAG: hypothetical protein EP319_05815 [Deltaproteobacteria bacterium]